MKKENLIIILLVFILMLLTYQTILLNRIPQFEGQKIPGEASETSIPSPEKPEKQLNPYAGANLKTEVFMNKDKTYGYQILLNGSPMIRQPNIPGLPGNAGFSDAKKAEKTASLVLLKIRKNIMPPAVTTEELDSLRVL